jgi:hypothetical protein
MVDDEDGKRVAALQLAQKGKQRGDLAAGVLIDPVQAHEGIEDEEARMQSGNGVLQSEAIGGKIEPQRGGGDDLDIEIAQVPRRRQRRCLRAAGSTIGWASSAA